MNPQRIALLEKRQLVLKRQLASDFGGSNSTKRSAIKRNKRRGPQIQLAVERKLDPTWTRERG
jgi:hypothetical protein